MPTVATALALATVHVALANQPDIELPPRDDVIVLSNGDELRGVATVNTDGSVSIDHPILGSLTLAADQVQSVDIAEQAVPPDPVSPPATPEPAKKEPVPAPKPPEKPKKNRGLFGTQFLEGYDKRINLGLTGTSGNRETLNTFARLTVKKDDDQHRTEFRADYFLNLTEGERSRNQARVKLNRDWKMPDSEWFFFGRGTYDYDEFQPWEHRFGLFFGPGYQFYDRENFELIGRIGVGGTYEFGDVNEFNPEGLAGLEGTWKLSERQRIEFSTTLFPLLDELGEYRNVSEVAYVIDIERLDGMQLKLGIENEYESRTQGDAAHNDLKYFTALSIDF